MKPTEVTISAWLKVDGELWPVRITAEIEGDGYRALLSQTAAAILKMKQAGFTLISVSNSLPPAPSVVRIPGGRPGPDFTWPAPMCPDCKKEMKLSKFQKDETRTNYHCTVKLPIGAYCNQQAAADNKTGSVDYWEVTK